MASIRREEEDSCALKLEHIGVIVQCVSIISVEWAGIVDEVMPPDRAGASRLSVRPVGFERVLCGLIGNISPPEYKRRIRVRSARPNAGDSRVLHSHIAAGGDCRRSAADAHQAPLSGHEAYAMRSGQPRQ